MKFHKILLAVACASFAMYSCNNDNSSDKDSKKDNTKVVFAGKIQKGPAKKGDTVTLVALTDDLTPTGDSVQTVVTDNNGSYAFTQAQIDSLNNPKQVKVKFSGSAYSEKTGKVEDHQKVEAVVAVSDSTATAAKADSVNVNTVTTAVAGEVQENSKKGGFTGDIKGSTKEVVKTVLEALQITNDSIINHYADPTKIDLNKDALLYTLSLVFGDDLKTKFLDPYKTIDKSVAPVWLSTMIGEGARQMFESLKQYAAYAEKTEGMEKPSVDVKTKSFAAVVKAVLMRDAADNLGSLTICDAALGIKADATHKAITDSLKAKGFKAEHLDGTKVKYFRQSSADLATLANYFEKPCEGNSAVRLHFVVKDRTKREAEANTIENIEALLKAGAIYAGTHALGTEVKPAEAAQAQPANN